MKKILTIYPNCSLGGMTSVYLGRLALDKNSQFDFIFINDKGGKDAFKNTNYRIINKDRLNNYFSYITHNITYNEIRITSLPELTQHITDEVFIKTKIIYEFHTSSLNVIENEIRKLNTSKINEIWVPSEYLKGIIQGFLSEEIILKVVPNIVNYDIFNPKNIRDKIYFQEGTQPIFWVGRLDKGKNYKDFFRLLSLLPEKYVGYLILSFEDDPSRISSALLETELYKINNRIHFLLNLTQDELNNLFVYSVASHGIFCSTSLAESFGYAPLEAALSGLPVVTYEVGGISGHKEHNFAIHMINVGDTITMAETITKLKWYDDYRKNIRARRQYIINNKFL